MRQSKAIQNSENDLDSTSTLIFESSAPGRIFGSLPFMTNCTTVRIPLKLIGNSD
jgi:hypothetical protein